MRHQKKAVKFLRKVDGVGALLMDPGTGKTGSALAYIDHLADVYGEVRVLVVAPLTAADTWVLQAEKFMDSPVKARMMQGTTASILPKIAASRVWANVPKAKIGLDHPGTMRKALRGNKVTILSMSAGAISSWCGTKERTVSMLRGIRAYAPHLIIVDESHIIKADTSRISQAMFQIGQLADRRVILTGTVNPHGPLDCFGQWRFLAPWTFSDDHGKKFTKDPASMTRDQKRQIKPWTWKRFSIRYGVMGGYGGSEIVDFQHKKELRQRVAERSLVVLKKDALDLPPTTDIDIHVELTAKERKAYKEMKEKLLAELEDGTLLEAPNPLSKYMKLRQITSGFVKDSETGETHVVGRSKVNAVKEVVNVQLAGKQRVVVFAYFRRECEELAAELAQKGRTVEIITGGTSAKNRLAIRQRFADVSGNPGPVVLVAQARTMSISVNELVTAQDAVYASLSERREDMQQSRDRLDRKGQTLPVTFWNVYVPDTVDEIMRDNHQRRGDMEAALKAHIQSK